MSAPARLTRGFLFADLRGYTAFVERHGDAAGATLLERYRALVRDAVKQSEGAEIKTEGDSFYVVFPSASRAVECALAIVEGARHASSDRPEAPIRVGVGVHAGETVDTPEGHVGSAVNLAARICARARPGEVLVSDTVRGLTRTGLEVTFEPRGRPRLKGIAEQIPLFAVLPRGAAPSAGRNPMPSWLRGRPALALAGAVVAVALGGFAILAAFRSSPGGEAAGQSPAQQVAGGTSGITELTPIPIVIPTGADARPLVELSPGRYVFSAFRPRTELEVPEGWAAVNDHVNGFDIGLLDDEGVIEGYISGAVIQRVFESPCFDSPTRPIESSPAALIDWLEGNDYLRTTQPVPATLSGYSGLSVDIQRARSPSGECEVPSDAPASFGERAHLFETGEDDFWIGPEERIRVSVVDVDGRPVTILVGTLRGDRFDSFVVESRVVLDSLRITP